MRCNDASHSVDHAVVVIVLFETAMQLHKGLGADSSQTRSDMQYSNSGRPKHRAGDGILHGMVGG